VDDQFNATSNRVSTEQQTKTYREGQNGKNGKKSSVRQKQGEHEMQRKAKRVQQQKLRHFLE
jgi:hypothetical protein